jgi:hypothetical protein
METASATVARMPESSRRGPHVEEEAPASSALAASMRPDVALASREPPAPTSVASPTTVTSPSAVAAPLARPARTWLLVALGAASLVVGALLRLRAQPHALSANEAATSPLTSAAAIDPGASSEPRAAAQPPPSAPPLPAPVPAAAATATPTARSVQSAAPSRNIGVSVSGPKRCNPPYTVDAHGVRHLRPECI